ncbi:MAG: bifunctional UDP-3-O-[3-hydroxymyristoyl] N-acetylglucosamine deacetylase/3-hydroxyacyl-ACP dehydratase [Chlorobi bacterium]|nr:bifunctional UDP-3-O-[3-hydroxymyristoyl] N-acetylglucosamine deacetylase/3-hydroxyacyl-ACP dehydratase [Chlorobiota bacterium]
MAEKQKTIGKSISISGNGLHTGQKGTMTFYPAPADHGLKFRRSDLEKKPIISATIENVVGTARGTTIGENGANVFTIEHVLAAFRGLGVDNALIDLDMEEIPILDGSSRFFLNAIKEAEVVDLDKDRDFIVINETIEYKVPDSKIEIRIEPSDTFELEVDIDYESRVLGAQHASLSDISRFEKEISKCRTFVFLHELEFLLSNNLIKGGDLASAIVFVNRKVPQEELDRLAKAFNKPSVKVKEEGILNNLELHYANEPARHKLLDMIGDLALLGKPIKGKITAKRPGHQSNTEFARIINQHLIKKEAMLKEPPFDIYAKPRFDVVQIQKMLPHRPPFLLVDKVLEMSDNHIIGMKSVTMNEPFFVGHFPGEPIMPGVLQVEAMAQVGGIFVLNQVSSPELYSTYFLKINDVRFRGKVVPGDTLIFSIELIAPIKRGICIMRGKAFVGDKLVMDGELTAQIVKNKD